MAIKTQKLGKMIIGLDGNEANVKNRVGSGIYAFQLLCQFQKNKRHEFLVFLKERPIDDFPRANKNFQYHIFGPKKLWTQFALPIKLSFGLPGDLQKTNVDIFASLGHYGPRFSKVPYVITVHDLSYLHFPKLFNKNDLYQLINWTKYSIYKSEHIIAVSKSTKEDIIKNYKVNPSKISVTYEGYDKRIFKSQPKAKINMIKNKYNINADYILFVGTLQPRKNLERLIVAFQKISGHFQLVIAGKKGWLYESIFSKVRELKLDEKVIFTDFVPDYDLPSLVSGAKAYVLPSLWEGFGIPVIEAQACGVPVIVSNVSSLPEIVEKSGLLVNPQSVTSIASGIEKVVTNEKLRQELIMKGFTNIRRFSWQKCAEETLDILEKIASKPIPNL